MPCLGIYAEYALSRRRICLRAVPTTKQGMVGGRLIAVVKGNKSCEIYANQPRQRLLIHFAGAGSAIHQRVLIEQAKATTVTFAENSSGFSTFRPGKYFV